MIRNKIQGRCRQIIENLRLSGYAFDAAKVNSERRLKISNLLENDSLVAQSFSPKLIDGSKIRIDFHQNSVSLYYVYKGSGVFLAKIENFYELKSKEQIYKISILYKKFFFYREQMEKVVDILGLKKSKRNMLLKINKSIPLRFYEVKDERVFFYFGASIFSMVVVYYVVTNEFKVFLILYKKQGKTYKEFNVFNERENYIKSKYSYVIRKLVNIKYLNNENINHFISAYLNFQTML